MFLHYLKKNVLDMCIFDKKRQKVTETVMWKILEEYKYLDRKETYSFSTIILTVFEFY